MLTLGGAQWRCWLGRGGVRVHKEEGDGATPAGLLPLRRVLYRADRGPAPATVVAVEPIAPADGWCDDPADTHYNLPVTLPHSARCEALWRPDALYDLVGVAGVERRAGAPWRGVGDLPARGAAGWRAHEGCVALALPDLRAALAAGLSALRVLAPD